MWHIGDSATTYSSDAEELPGPMAFYSSTGLGQSSLASTYHQSIADHEQIGSSREIRSPSPGKSRGNTPGSKAAKIKRSMSTPNVRGQASADAAAMALSADKRRNKLGYHRTSVACGKSRTTIVPETRTDCVYRPLPKAKDSLYSRARRSPKPMLKLYQTEEGM